MKAFMKSFIKFSKRRRIEFIYGKSKKRTYHLIFVGFKLIAKLLNITKGIHLKSSTDLKHFVMFL